MATEWTVERNTGSLAYLVSGRVTKHVKRPSTMSRQEFFRFFTPGSSVLDDTLKGKFEVIL
jgi:hypothetical protein